MIRIIQKAIFEGGRDARPGDTVDDVVCGLGVLAVDVDGVRIDSSLSRVIAVETAVADDEVGPANRIVIEIHGPIEYAFAISDGPDRLRILGLTDRIQRIGRIDYETTIRRPVAE